MKLVVAATFALCGLVLAPNAEVAFRTINNAWREMNPPAEVEDAKYYLDQARMLAGIFAESCPLENEADVVEMSLAETKASVSVQELAPVYEQLTQDQLSELKAAAGLADFAIDAMRRRCGLSTLPIAMQ